MKSERVRDVSVSTEMSVLTDDVDEHKEEPLPEWRQWIFPIYNHELIRLIPLNIMMFCALFSYSCFRDCKDSIVMSEGDQTPISLQWAHVLFVLPLSFLITMVLMKLSTVVSKDFIFASVTITFTSFFLIHAFCLHPNRAALHKYFQRANQYIHENCSSDSSIRILIPLCGALFYPINTLQFAAADIWGTLSISILVFGFVNDITPKAAARRYYVTIGILSQAGPIISGTIVSSLMNTSSGSGDPQQFTESYQFITIIGVSIMYVMMIVYFYVRIKLMKSAKFRISEKQLLNISKVEQKETCSFWETVSFTFSHKYILSVAGILCGYNWLNAIIEHTWKDVLHLYFSGCPNGYTKYRALVTTFTAVLTFFAMMFGGHNALRIVGWKITALMCPFVLVFGSLVFYLYGINNPQHFWDEQSMQFLPLPACAIMVLVGATILTFEKSLKYSTCDPTKEIAYLYLNNQEKYKGKIAVEMLGSKFGKVFGALFNIFLVSAINERSFFVSSQYCALIGIIIGGTIWISSISYLDSAIKIKQQLSIENAIGECVISTQTK